MAVLDHEVHEKVKIGADFKYGCNNDKPRGKGYWVQEREYRSNGTYIMMSKFIPFRMSVPCRNFYLWDTDNACRSCPREKDIEYALQMSALT